MSEFLSAPGGGFTLWEDDFAGGTAQVRRDYQVTGVNPVGLAVAAGALVLSQGAADFAHPTFVTPNQLAVAGISPQFCECVHTAASTKGSGPGVFCFAFGTQSPAPAFGSYFALLGVANMFLRRLNSYTIADFTDLANTGFGPTIGRTYKVTGVINGANIDLELFENGTSILTATDAGAAAARGLGVPGICTIANTPAGSASLDNLRMGAGTG